MSAPLTMQQAAGEVGLSYERFRKVWAGMCKLQGFPAPIRGRAWDADAVAAWKIERSRAPVVTELRAPSPQQPKGAARARQALHQLRAG